MASRVFSEFSRRRRRWVAVGLVALAVVWVLVNGPVEGPVLLVLTQSHGVTLADLGSLAALAVAGALYWS